MSSDHPTYHKKLNALPGDPFVKAFLVFAVLFSAVKHDLFPEQLLLPSKATHIIILIFGTLLLYVSCLYEWKYCRLNAQCLLNIVYRIWFHPLSKYPGPLVASFTDWYSVYHCMLGDRHIDFYKLHQKYGIDAVSNVMPPLTYLLSLGSIVRYGPHRIAVNTNTGLGQIYHVHAPTQKSHFFSVFSHFFKVPMIMTTINPKVHAFKRRVASKALSPNAIKELEPAVLRNVRKFCQKMVDDDPMPGGWSSTRNISRWAGWLTNDIMGDVTFHRNWNMLDSPENRDIVTTLTQGVGGLNMVGHMPNILKLHLDKILFRKSLEGTYKFQRLSHEQSTWRIEHGDSIKERDIFRSLLDARDPETGKGFSEVELVSESGLLIIAGSQTIRSATSATVFYFLHNPATFDIAQREIASTFADVEDIRNDQKLLNCHYLFACITEAMRMSPGVGGIVLREVLPPGLLVDGELLPAGTDVGVANYAIHHNESYFPNSFTYNPSRWLTSDQHATGVSAEEVQRAKSAYAPFSAGRSSCLGRHLAEQELMVILGRLLFLYDWRITPGSTMGEGSDNLGKDRCRKDEFQTYDFFVARHEGPEVQFRNRQVN